MRSPGTREIRALRPAREPVDPARPIGQRWDIERGVRTEWRRVLTVFLAGAECPFTCLFCDLWRHTLDGPTPPGALPTQLALALEEADRGAEPIGRADALKLYNASNFFDARAAPPSDDAALVRLCERFARVTVETHARLVGERAAVLAHALEGRLEIAMGLETVHPVVFPRLNKGMELADFEDAVEWARERDIGTRAFVLVGLPWVPPSEFAKWAVRSARFAADLGVERLSLIPLRRGNGILDDLATRGDLRPVRLRHLEDALELALEEVGEIMIVDADLWDADRLSTCARCAVRRVERLSAANLQQVLGARVPCDCRD
ncbi:MAG: radical SAM protein [Gemmatimonadota bacterium]